MLSRTRIYPWLVVFLLATSASVRGAPPDSAKAGGDARTLAAANGFLSRGLYDLAIEEYLRFLETNPDHPDSATARYGLGVAFFRSNKLPESADALAPLEGKEGFAFAVEVAVLLGQCRLAAGDFAGAAESFQKVERKQRSHALADDATSQLIEALFRANDAAGAAKAADRFVTNWPDSPQLDRALYFGGLASFKLGDHAASARRFAEVCEKRPDSPFAAHSELLLAQSLQAMSKSQAAGAYRKVLSRGNSPYRDEAALGLAAILRREGDFKGAADLLVPLADKDSKAPLSREAAALLAHVRFDQGDYAAALELFDWTKGAADAQYWCAKCKLRLNRPDDAAGDIKAAIDESPSSPLLAEMWYDLAVAQHRSGDRKAAARSLKTFRERFANHELMPMALQLSAAVAHESGEYQRSLEFCATFLAKEQESPIRASVQFLVGENEFLLGRYAKAIDSFRKFLADFPADDRAPVAKYRLGMSLYQRQSYDEAYAVLGPLQKEKGAPSFSALRLAIGDIEFRRGEWRAAREHFDAYLASGDDRAATDEALLKAGLCEARLGRLDAAAARFSTIIEKHAQSPHALQARFERGQAYLLRKEYPKAAADLEEVVTADADSPFAAPARRHLAAIAAQQGDYSAAARGFEEWADSAKGDDKAEAFYQQGVALAASKDAKAAQRVFQKVIRQHAKSPRADAARAQLILLLARANQCDEATGLFEKLNTKAVDPPLLRSAEYERAWCLKTGGRVEEAAKAFRALIEESDGDAVAAHAMVDLAELEAGGGRYEEAARWLTSCQKIESAGTVELAPALREQALYKLGIAHFKLNDFSRAAEVLGRFEQTFVKSDLLPSATYFRGESLYHTGDFAAAADCFDRVAAGRKEGDETEAALLRAGECRAKLQQWAKSESAFASFLDRFKLHEQWYQAEFGLGWARENQSQYSDAVKCYRRVVERHQGPTAARAQFQIGQCLFAEKKLNEAVAELLKVDILYAYPDWSAAALYEAGRCFEQLNKTAEAKRQFQTVSEKYKSTKWAELATARLDALASSKVPGRG